MCTVTIVPLVAGAAGAAGSRKFRLACNRDESVTRPAAKIPRAMKLGERTALMPVDPVSGGTWIAVNDAGLAMTLLNATPSPGGPAGSRRSRPLLSRGLIIPGLLACASLAQAVRQAIESIDPASHAPFRLVITDGMQLADLISNTRRLQVGRGPLGGRPRLFTSSGLGDLVVRGPRARLFSTMFRAKLHSGEDPAQIQDAFHRHSWPDLTHLSVCMRRPRARTVSHTVIEADGADADIIYYGAAPDTGVTPSRLSMEIRMPFSLTLSMTPVTGDRACSA